MRILFVSLVSSLLFVVPTASVCSEPATVTARFSRMFDQGNRAHLPNCPSMVEARVHVARALVLWETDGEMLLSRIRTAVAMDSFPAEPIFINVVSCGRSTSDPFIISPYGGGPDGPFVPVSDEDILRKIAHELLHYVAISDEYSRLRKRLKTRYPYVEDVVFNHILVAALEARLYGYEYVKETYTRPAYTRALRLAAQERLIEGVRPPL